MAKSQGNFFRLRDILERGYTGREVRYVLASAHYRQALNFTFSALDAARSALTRLDEFRARLRRVQTERAVSAPADAALPDWAQAAKERFERAVQNDLAMADAYATVFDLAHEGHRHINRGETTPNEAEAVTALMRQFDCVLGFLEPDEEAPDEMVQELVQLRQTARSERNFAEADRLRDELGACGWAVKDTPEGPQLRRQKAGEAS